MLRNNSNFYTGRIKYCTKLVGFLFLRFYLFYVCECLPEYMSVCHMHDCPKSLEEGIRSPEIVVTDGFELPCGC